MELRILNGMCGIIKAHARIQEGAQLDPPSLVTHISCFH